MQPVVQRLGSELLFVSVMHVPKNKPQVVIVVLFRRDGSGSAAEMCWVWLRSAAVSVEMFDESSMSQMNTEYNYTPTRKRFLWLCGDVQ